MPHFLKVSFLLFLAGGAFAETEVHGIASRTNTTAPALPFPWPPRVGERYPPLEFGTPDGKVKRLSDFKGKVVLVEPIGMNCPACQAFAGAHRVGSFRGITPQGNLRSIEETLPRYAGGVKIGNPRLVYIQLLLFNMDMKPVTAKDVADWAMHFNRNLKYAPIVVAGAPEFLLPPYYQATYHLVPGFQLIDQDGVLRYDATGHQPRHSLWTELLPAVPELLNETALPGDSRKGHE
jgi:hypothetical protein